MNAPAVTSKRVRPGLYLVTNATGERFHVENRQAPGDGYGTAWAWYITSLDRTLWLDPEPTKAATLDVIANLAKEN